MFVRYSVQFIVLMDVIAHKLVCTSVRVKMQQVSNYLSETVRQLSKERAWSLDKTAAQTGGSKAMHGQIERGESSTTMATLWKIATGFGVSLSSFIEPAEEDEKALLIREPVLQSRILASESKPVNPVFAFDERFGFELFELTLEAGVERLSEPHEAGVTEHIIVLSGSMELLIGEQWLSLAKGSAVRFAADQPHGYRNSGKEPVVFHDIIHYAKKR